MTIPFFIFLFLVQETFGQTFINAYSGVNPTIFVRSVYSSYFNAFFIAGTYNDVPILSKIDRNGNLEWTRQYQSGLYIEDIVELNVPGQDWPDIIICMGEAGSYYDIHIVRISGKDGSVLWGREIIPSQAVRFSKVAVSSDQKIIANAIYLGNAGMFYIKLDENGNNLWARSFSIPGAEFSATSQLESDHNGGVISSFASGSDYTGLFSVDNNGTISMLKRSSVHYILRSISKTKEGYLFSAMRSWTERGRDQALIKTDKNFNTQWAKTINPQMATPSTCSICDWPKAVEKLNGDIWHYNTSYLPGFVSLNFLKFSSTGQLLVSKSTSETNVFIPTMFSLPDDNFTMTGYTTREVCSPTSAFEKGFFAVFGDDIDICETVNITPAIGNENISFTDLPFSTVSTSVPSFVVNPMSTSSQQIYLSKYDLCTNQNEVIDLGPDIQTCTGPIVLNAGSGFASYKWSTGSTTPEIDVFSSGTYSVSVTTACGTILRDTIDVIFDAPIIEITADNNPVKPGEIVELSTPALPNQKYKWEPATLVNDPTAPIVRSVITADTWFYLTVIDTNGCKSSDSILIEIMNEDDTVDIFIPSAFSPNNDGINDVLFVMSISNKVDVNYFRVYNRWGQMVFSVENAPANNRQFGWNGTYKSEPSPTDSYIYVAEATLSDGRKVFKKGSVTLIR